MPGGWINFVVLLAAGVSCSAGAQNYPNKPVKLVVGFAPAGAADYVARALSEPLRDRKSVV